MLGLQHEGRRVASSLGRATVKSDGPISWLESTARVPLRRDRVYTARARSTWLFRLYLNGGSLMLPVCIAGVVEIYL